MAKNKKTAKNFIITTFKWISVFISFLFTLAAFTTPGKWVSGLVFLASLLLILPPLNNRLTSLLPILQRTGVLFGSYVLVFFVGLFLIPVTVGDQQGEKPVTELSKDKKNVDKSVPVAKEQPAMTKEEEIALVEKAIIKSIKSKDVVAAESSLEKLKELAVDEKKLVKYEKQILTLKDKERQKYLNTKYKETLSNFNKSLKKSEVMAAKEMLSDIKANDPDFKEIASLEKRLAKATKQKYARDVRKINAHLKKFEFDKADVIISDLQATDIDQKTLDKIEKEKLKWLDQKELRDTLKILSSLYARKEFKDAYYLSEDLLVKFPKHKKVNWYHRNSKKEENKLVKETSGTIMSWTLAICAIFGFVALRSLPGRRDGRTKTGYKLGEEGDSASVFGNLVMAFFAFLIGAGIATFYEWLFLI